MSGILVPTIRTTYTNSQMIRGFIDGWHRQFGIYPHKESVGVLWAQGGVETGLTTSMWNNNVGNIKYTSAAGEVEYMMLNHVAEYVGGKKVYFEPPHPATWFRSFTTLSQGIAYYMDFLKNHRYKAAWAAVETGSISDFAHLLKIAGYYTAPEADYVKAMSYYYKKFMADNTFENIMVEINGATNSTPPTVDPTPVIISPPPNIDQPPQVVTLPTITINASIWAKINAFIINILKFGLKG